MEDFELHPSQRVFHLDEECYVLYLGRDTEDYKPFLRVGTARSLPEEVRPLIYSVVVTDLLPGSPLCEQENIPPGYGEEFRYIGDPDAVERFKTYLHHKEIPTVGYQEAHEELEEHGAYAYFYDDGNLRLKFNKNEIFNLKRREEQDRHYPQRAREIKKLFRGSRTKYPGDALDGSGFFIVGGTAYLFSRGRVAALGTDEDYFAELAACGIDPDRIWSVAAHDVDEGLVRLLKRVRGTGRLRVVSEHPEAVRPICELFAGDGKLALSYEITRLGTEKFIQLLDYRIRAAEGGYEVERSDAHTTLHLGSTKGAGDGLSVDPTGLEYRFSAGDVRGDGPLLEGVPYRIVEDTLPETGKLIEDYLPAQTAGARSDILSANEDAAVAAMVDFFRLAAARADTQAAVKNVRATLDRVEEEVSPLFWVYLENARSIAELLAARENGQSRGYRQFLSALLKRRTPPSGCRLLPLQGRIFTAAGPSDSGAAPLVLHSLTAHVTADSLAFAGELVERYAEATGPTDPAVFDAERERLYELLAGLDLVKARIPKHERTEEREQAEAERQAKEGTATRVAEKATGSRKAGETDAGTAAARTRKPSTSRKARRERRRRTVAGVVGVLAVLLLAGLAYLLLGPGLPGTAGPAVAGVEDAGNGAEGTAGDGGNEGGPGDESSGDGGQATATNTEEESLEEEMARRYPGLEPRESVGGIVITILDIIEMANRIAVDNGYRPMGGPEEAGPDPDWIYPGNVFTLPDGTTHTVVEGDTIWDIAADFIERELAVEYQQYLDIMTRYEDGDANREEVIDQLVSLRESTYSENFESLLQETIEEVQAGE
jgi:hypothetical protein